jgi:PAS domain S-box-containing protein
MVQETDDGQPGRPQDTVPAADVTDQERARASLRESETRYRTLFSTIDEGFCIIEFLDGPHGPLSDYVHVEANPAYERHAGIPNVVGQKVREMVPDEADGWVERYRRVLLTGEPIRFERELVATGRHLELSAFRVEPVSRRQVAVLFQDVTARKRAEEALKRSEQRYRALTTASSDVAYKMSADWSVLYPLDGRSLIASNSQPIRDWLTRNIPADEHARIRAAIAKAIAGKSLFEFEHRVTRPDGSTGWTFSRAVPIVDESGEVIEWFGAAADITDRKRAEEALRESEARFRQMADSMAHMIWVTRPDGFHEWYNRRWYEFTGVPDRTTDGAAWNGMFHPDDQERAWTTWRHSLATGEAYEIEYRLRHHSGEYRWVLGRALPIRNDAGDITRWFGTCTDIHAMRQLTEEREYLLQSEQAARVEAERASRMKEEFLATLSHEIRTPLNAILGWAMMLRSGRLGPESAAEGIEVIERNARAQAQIIEDLLDMSRIISGKLRLDVQRSDLAKVIEAAAETVAPAAAAKDIRVQLVLDPRTGPVSGDPGRLQQVFWNLLSNAIKFTPKGGRVQVLLERVSSHLDVSIVDTGDGIDPAFLPHVFDRFRQADATTTRLHGGLGLGLAIVKQLVELHGGTVRAKSPGQGQGATFIVSLPLTVLATDGEPLPSRRHPAAELTPMTLGENVRLPGIRVLVVDDEPDARALLRRLLEEAEAEVSTAAAATEALALVQAERPDVIISDIGMPREDGYSLIRQVRELPPERGGRTPAIALTAYARAEDRVRTLLEGFQHHLSKPVEPAELIAMVSSLVDGR